MIDPLSAPAFALIATVCTALDAPPVVCVNVTMPRPYVYETQADCIAGIPRAMDALQPTLRYSLVVARWRCEVGA